MKRPLTVRVGESNTSGGADEAREKAEHVEDLLDGALAETFPASDPISIAMDAVSDSPRPSESESDSAPRR